jgi:hypothetical protein
MRVIFLFIMKVAFFIYHVFNMTESSDLVALWCELTRYNSHFEVDNLFNFYNENVMFLFANN